MDPNNEPKKVVFEEENNWGAIKYYRQPTATKMVQWLVKHSGGLIKNDKQANYLLIAFALVIFAISLFIFFGGGHAQPKVPANVLQQMKQIPVGTSR